MSRHLVPQLLLLAYGLPLSGLAAQSEFEKLYSAAAAVPTGQAAQRRQAYARAYMAFARLAADSPGYARTRELGARCAMQAGMFAAAADLLAEHWDAGSRSDAVLARRLTAMLRAGRGREAAGLARASAARYPAGLRQWMVQSEDAGRRSELAGALLLEEPELGLWLFEAEVEASPAAVYALANLALAYRQLGRGAAALSTYEKALRLAPRQAWIHNDQGLLLKGMRRYPAAATAFARAIQVEAAAGASAGGTNLGILYRRSGQARGREPVGDLRRVLGSRPRAALARRVLLDLLAAEGRRSLRGR